MPPMMPPPLTPPSPSPAIPRVGQPVYQLQYGHHHGLPPGRMPNFSTSGFMVPYGRTSETASYAPMTMHLNASNTHYQTPYHLAPLPDQGSPESGLLSPPVKPVATTAVTTHTVAETRGKPKLAKPKPKKLHPSRISKPKAPKSGKAKQRPQSSKHLTPSLRAAIITLKVTDPNKSFKEIGEILSLPTDDDEVDEADENVAAEGENEHSATADNGAVDIITLDNGLETPRVAGDAITDPNLESITSNNSTTLPTKASEPKSKTKPRNRKPIPRNTVAGIFKRAVDRAGTDSDLYKLLEQTGRRAGSGRPRKGTGKKDREVAVQETSTVANSMNETWQADLDNAAANGANVDGASGLGIEMGLDDEDGTIDMDGLEMDGLDMEPDPDGQGDWNTDDDGGGEGGVDDGE